MKRRYTKVTLEQVAELYYQGYNFSQIAVRLNCSRNTIRAKIREYASKHQCRIYVGHGRPLKEVTNASRHLSDTK
jgi:uncharacterized protein YjcR